MARNLLFITTDQQRWDSLPCYGLDFMQTPALDRLAAEGMVFENCSVSSPVCVPCRASFLSGQYGLDHRRTRQRRLAPPVCTNVAIATGSHGATHRWHRQDALQPLGRFGRL